MRLIDADALDYELGASDRDIYVRECLAEAPSVVVEPHWIPVTERLPKEDGSYLVSGKWGSGKESVGDCEFSVEDGYFRTAWNFDVLAWCELPEPYKG